MNPAAELKPPTAGPPAAATAVPLGGHASPTAVDRFMDEAEAYALLARANWHVPRHARSDEAMDFAPREPVVVKGMATDLWHKSEAGCVKFLPFGAEAVATAEEEMRRGIPAERWRGALVCEQVRSLVAPGLPSEGFVSLQRHEAGWIALVGFGGLAAETLGRVEKPLRWPLFLMTAAEALPEFERHLLGRTWLGLVRGTRPLLTRQALLKFLGSLWRLAEMVETAGVRLIECNPVVIDATGVPCALDGVGTFGPPPELRPFAAPGFLKLLRAPRRIAIAGVSSHGRGPGRTILENLQQCPSLRGNLVVVKDGTAGIMGVPCVSDVRALAANPVDLLIVAVPAAAAVDIVVQLLAQGGGAQIVAVVSGGLGDGADRDGLGIRLRQVLAAAKAEQRWTPWLLGPNFLGHWVPGIQLDSSFIASERTAHRAPAIVATHEKAGLVLLSQSGAFLLSRHSRQPWLDVKLAVALGNEFDLALADFLHALAQDGPHVAVAYVEGFGPGELGATINAAAELVGRGGRVVVHRAGRSAAGHAAAASHTGALAGDCEFERDLLRRAGVRFSGSVAQLDAACAWLSCYPHARFTPPAVISVAGFETVNAADLGPDGGSRLEPELRDRLRDMLAEEKLGHLVTPRLPLDLTPMAPERVFLRAIEILAAAGRHTIVVGLVPFAPNVQTDAIGAGKFAGALAEVACHHALQLGVVVDAGDAYARYRDAFAEARLPVFTRMEDALLGVEMLYADR